MPPGKPEFQRADQQFRMSVDDLNGSLEYRVGQL
jgi:hypothetical protein